MEKRPRRSDSFASNQEAPRVGGPRPGARSRSHAVYGGLGSSAAASPRAVAESGFVGRSQSLPHLERIQASFGDAFDLQRVCAYVGGPAQAACEQLGAHAYALGQSVAFASGEVDLHTAAHEAAHVVQQSGQLQALGGFGTGGDLELHADAVAAAVVSGQSAVALLRAQPAAAAGVQLKPDVGATTDFESPFVPQALPTSGVVRRNYRDTCDGRRDQGCYMGESERRNVLIELTTGHDIAHGNFAQVLLSEEIRRKLKPESDLWELVIDASYVVAGSAGSALLKKAANNVQSTAHAVADTALKIATRAARNEAKGIVGSIRSESAHVSFIRSVRDVLARQRQLIVRAAATELDDEQREALAAYYDSKNHTETVYRKYLEGILQRFEDNVLDIGKYGKTAVLIQGPYGPRQRRLAMCRQPWSQATDPRSEGSYRFMHWIAAGYENMAYARELHVQGSAMPAFAGVSFPPRANPSVQVVEHGSPKLSDESGEIARWVEQSAPQFAPATYHPANQSGGARTCQPGDETAERMRWPDEESDFFQEGAR